VTTRTLRAPVGCGGRHLKWFSAIVSVVALIVVGGLGISRGGQSDNEHAISQNEERVRELEQTSAGREEALRNQREMLREIKGDIKTLLAHQREPG